MAHAGFGQRFGREAKAISALNHPHICTLYDVGPDYLVMELVRGISLHELVTLNGPLKTSMACDVGMQIAEALEVAHRNGIIHRDIKPANFLIEPNGVARILDFGLAMISDVSDDEFSLSMVFGHDCLGTPDYISPEQSLDSRNIDARADIYSLGATLFVALTAHVPFPEKSNKAKLEAQRSKKPRNVCELRPEIPPEIGAIILKMMEKDPARRFQSAAEVVEAFRPFAKRKSVQFDFRELITLRAKQAKAKAEATGRKAVAPKSSITSASGWIATDGHDLADRLHARAQAAIREAELLERPARDLDDAVVERGLEARRRLLRDVVRDLVERLADREHGADLGDWEACRLARERGAA